MLKLKELGYVFHGVHPLWEELRDKNIFISGGTGWFGRWMVETLLYANECLDLNCHLTILTRFQHVSTNPNVTIWTGDINNTDFPHGEYQYVIHLAVDGTERMLEFARKCKAQKFLFTSSGAVYKTNVDKYAQKKINDEYLCMAHDTYFDIKIARCFSFVGPYISFNKNFAIANFIRSAINEGKVSIYNENNTPYRTYLYMADLAIWLWTILFIGEPGLPYDVGGKKVYSVRQVAELVAELSGAEIEYGNGKTLSYDYVPDISHALALGLNEWIHLKEAIQYTLNFYKK